MDLPVTRVYSLGSNGSGQLGVGHRDDLNEPQICHFEITRSKGQGTDSESEVDARTTTATSLPDGDTVKKLVAGGNHTVILTDHGQVWVSGDDSDGRCGIGASMDGQGVSVFRRMECMKGRTVTDVAATWEATFVVTDAKAVWSCGSGRKGELGAGEQIEQTRVPVKIFDGSEVEIESGWKGCGIVSISGSMNHVVVLLENGTAYGWGNSRKGQLGSSLQTKKIVWMPMRVNLSCSFLASHVVTGRDFTLFAGPDGSHILFGDFKAAELPATESIQREVRYFAGWSTIYSLDRGQVRGWGLCRRGQLPPANLPSTAIIAAGSEHCIALLDDGTVAAWGWGEHGNCGLPVDNRSSVINRFNILSTPMGSGEVLTGVGAGCASSFIWTISCG